MLRRTLLACALLIASVPAASVMAQTAPAARVFELRTYHCFEGRLEALKARFRDHTIEIFKRHGMRKHRLLGAAGPGRSKTTLIYIIAHPSREAANAATGRISAPIRNGKRSSADVPEATARSWQKSRNRVFMDPTDFSKLK